MLVRSFARLTPIICLFVWATLPAAAQTGAKNGEWRTYGADLGNTRYSPLDQINAENFNKLEIAWRFKTDSLGAHPDHKLEGTPLMAEGRHLHQPPEQDGLASNGEQR